MSLILVNPPMLPAGRGRTAGAAVSFLDWQRSSLRPDQYYSMPMEHLGLMTIASFAERRGLQVETVNGVVLGHPTLDDTWQEMLESARRTGAPAVVGFSNIDTFEEVLELARRCRSEWPGAVVVLGNTFAALNYARVLAEHGDCFDAVVVGEGELPFAELAEAVLGGRSLEAITGVACRAADGSVAPPALSAVDLDTLPWAKRTELPAVLAAGFAPAVFTTRGCPYRCTFCGTGSASAMLGRNGYRARSVDDVLDEIEYLVRYFGIEFLSISDDLFLSKHPAMQARAEEFANGVLRRGIRLRFMIDARVDSMADLGLFARLRDAGLVRVFVGLETGSYEQLLAYGKRHVRRGEDPAARIRAVRDLGIEVIPGTIMFHPEVTAAELRETARLIRETGYAVARKLTERVVAYPGTPLYRDYAAKGYLVRDWPLGEWVFRDPQMAALYQDLTDHIRSQADLDFDAAESYLLARLSERGAQSYQPTTGRVIGQDAEEVTTL
jgi:radical SAM superfamily enzyme YgiQ (UPF0313 family)